MDYDQADEVAGHYNDSNRAFLQALIAQGSITIEEGKKLLAAIFTVHENKETEEGEVTQEDLDSYISAAADAISPFDFEIRNTQHQITKKRIYAVVNSSSDALTQFATTKSPEEIAYVKRFLDAMFDTNNRPSKEIMAVSGMQSTQGALRKGAGRQDVGEDTQSVDKGVTVEQTEKLLARMVKEDWLERSKAGYYSLAPRALMELRSWLVETYNDGDDPNEWQRIKFCEACKELITVGQRCANVKCNVRLHNICEAAYWNSRPAKKCPKCHTAWSGKAYVGEKVLTTTEEYLKGKRRSGGAKRAREEVEVAEEDEERQPQRRQKSGRATQLVNEEVEEDAEEEEEEEEAEEEDEDEDENESDAQSGSGRHHRRNGKRAQQAASESEEEDDEDGEDDG